MEKKMEIRFASLKEIKEFILMVDIYQLCDKQDQEIWHGRYIIDNKYHDAELNAEDFVITDPSESRVVHRGHVYCISTPYYKQIGWLYETLEYFAGHHYDINIQGKEIDENCLREYFHVCCNLYFKKCPDHTAKELMLYIIDSLKRFAVTK